MQPPPDNDELQPILEALGRAIDALDDRIDALERRAGIRLPPVQRAQFAQAFTVYSGLVEQRAERLSIDQHRA